MNMPSMNRHQAWWCALCTVSCLVGCAPDAAPPFAPTGDSVPEPVPDRFEFARTVAPILEARGCATAECHGGGRHPFPLTGDLELDYYRAADQVNGTTPPESPLLRKPLAAAAGGSAHDAPTIFQTASDPDYQRLLSWAMAGAEQ